MAATEEFSFPIITDTVSYSIDSPPLWCSSPAASPNRCHEETSKQRIAGEESDQEEDYKDCFPTAEPLKFAQRKSFSCIEKGAKAVKRDGGEDDREEKMDMLWEDFNNEELFTRSYSSKLESDVVSMGCVEALKVSKTSGAIFSPRKPGLVVFMKVLKKLFLLHNSHRTMAKRRFMDNVSYDRACVAKKTIKS